MPEILSHSKGYYLFQFEDEEDCTAVMNMSWFFNSKPLVLRVWSSNFDIDESSLDMIPTRIQLPDVGLEYWSLKTLDKPASKVGRPICTDRLTATKGRISYPRILVDVSTKVAD